MVRLPLVTEHSEEMPVVQSTYFDSLRSATRSVTFLNSYRRGGVSPPVAVKCYEFALGFGEFEEMCCAGGETPPLR